MAQPPPAEGARLPWSAIPAHLRAQVERLLGARVQSAVTQRGGFSPGVAARLTLSGGGKAFVKAVGDINPESPDLHRAEARIAAMLPGSTPAPRLLGSIDADGWVILAFTDVAGRLPVQPWRPAELTRVLAAVTDLAAALTSAPVEAPPAADRYWTLGHGWQRLAADAASGADDMAGLDPWTRARVGDLAALEEGRWSAAVAGSTLAHGDVRADNILLTADQVTFVDWPWACLAPPWFDLVTMLPSVALHGGPPPEDVLAAHPLARDADADDVTTVVAALAGTLLYLSRQPDPPGLPTVRAFQRAHATAALGWLSLRLRTSSAGLGLG